jgi:hypothetical protein
MMPAPRVVAVALVLFVGFRTFANALLAVLAAVLLVRGGSALAARVFTFGV